MTCSLLMLAKGIKGLAVIFCTSFLDVTEKKVDFYFHRGFTLHTKVPVETIPPIRNLFGPHLRFYDVV